MALGAPQGGRGGFARFAARPRRGGAKNGEKSRKRRESRKASCSCQTIPPWIVRPRYPAPRRGPLLDFARDDLRACRRAPPDPPGGELPLLRARRADPLRRRI